MSTPSPAPRCTAMSAALLPRAARSSRCCRPTTQPATSRRSRPAHSGQDRRRQCRSAGGPAASGDVRGAHDRHGSSWPCSRPGRLHTRLGAAPRRPPAGGSHSAGRSILRHAPVLGSEKAAAIAVGGEADEPAESSAEQACLTKSELHGDLSDRECLPRQQGFSPLYALRCVVTMRRQAERLLEGSGEVIRTKLRDGCECGQ